MLKSERDARVPGKARVSLMMESHCNYINALVCGGAVGCHLWSTKIAESSGVPPLVDGVKLGPEAVADTFGRRVPGRSRRDP